MLLTHCPHCKAPLGKGERTICRKCRRAQARERQHHKRGVTPERAHSVSIDSRPELRPNPFRCQKCGEQIAEGHAVGGENPDGTRWAEHADPAECVSGEGGRES